MRVTTSYTNKELCDLQFLIKKLRLNSFRFLSVQEGSKKFIVTYEADVLEHNYMSTFRYHPAIVPKSKIVLAYRVLRSKIMGFVKKLF